MSYLPLNKPKSWSFMKMCWDFLYQKIYKINTYLVINMVTYMLWVGGVVLMGDLRNAGHWWLFMRHQELFIDWLVVHCRKTMKEMSLVQFSYMRLDYIWKIIFENNILTFWYRYFIDWDSWLIVTNDMCENVMFVTGRNIKYNES